MGTYDVIVVGLGGMGSAAAHQLAARGQRVLGIEQFRAAHDLGSSHGRTGHGITLFDPSREVPRTPSTAS